MFKTMLIVALAGLAAEQAPSANKPAPSPFTVAEQAQLLESITRGEQLYRYDQAAWHSTDALLRRLDQPTLALVRGWVVTEAPDGHRAAYYGRSSDSAPPYLVYSALWDGKRISDEQVGDPQEPQPLSAEQMQLLAAVDAARPVAAGFKRCNDKPFNMVALKGRTPADPISVYFLTPQTRKDSYPFGGHHRVDVQAGKVVAQRAFTKSCMEMSPMAPKGGKAVAMVVTHLLDPVPTEVHVFSVYASGYPLYVGVRDRRIYQIGISRGRPEIRMMPLK